MNNWLKYAVIVVSSLLGLSAIETSAVAKGHAEHMIVVVWDGMRPDFITPQYTPTLYWLATRGVFFRNNHCAFISSTEVNGTALATGMHPSHSGVIANVDYRPELSFVGGFGTENYDAVMRADLLTGGNYLLVPTVAEMLHAAGIRTMIAGTKPVVLLHDRAWKRPNQAAEDSVVVSAGNVMPRALDEDMRKANRDRGFPTSGDDLSRAQDNWTANSLIKGLWKNGLPKFSVLWMAEPDKSQHASGVGSDAALSAIENSDRRLNDLVKALDDKNLLDKTDLFVVSDHGFSTVGRSHNIVDILRRQGFNATTRFDRPEPGDVLVINLGGSATFHVMNQEENVIRDLVSFLQTTDFAGVIFSRLDIEGTFSLQQVEIGTTNNAPDVVVAMRWTDEKNEHGAPGLLNATGGEKGRGHHASLSRFDMNNTLVAAGPDFKKGLLSRTASGNIDIVPTVMWLLGVNPPHALDGRVLHEALATSTESAPKPVERTIEATREVGFFRWHQYMKFVQMGNTTYFSEGNGEATLK